jgi:hypothetical protein
MRGLRILTQNEKIERQLKIISMYLSGKMKISIFTKEKKLKKPSHNKKIEICFKPISSHKQRNAVLSHSHNRTTTDP